MEKDKNKIIYILIIIVILILIILGIYKVIQNREAENITTEEATEENSDTLTPEEVLEQMEEDETVILSDSAKVSIISPEGELRVVCSTTTLGQRIVESMLNI